MKRIANKPVTPAKSLVDLEATRAIMEKYKNIVPTP